MSLKQIIIIIISFIIAFNITVISVSAQALPDIPPEFAEVIDFAKYVAEKNDIPVDDTSTMETLKAAGLTASMFQPYLVGVLAVGSLAYLGYDVYTNYDEIEDNITTWLLGHSAFADAWFEEYALSIMNDEVAMSQGVLVPINIFQDMVMAMSTVLTVDNNAIFNNIVTRLSEGNVSVTENDLNDWLVGLGYTGGYSAPYTYTISNPVMCVYNQEIQDYKYFRYDLGTKAKTDDLLMVQIGSDLVVGNLYNPVTNEMPGYALTYQYSYNYNQVVSTKENGWVTAYSFWEGDPHKLPNVSIADGEMTIEKYGDKYNVAFLCPSDDDILLSNTSYSEWVHPMTVQVHDNSAYPDYVNNRLVLPVWWGVQVISGNPIQPPNAIPVDPVISDDNVIEIDDEVYMRYYPSYGKTIAWVDGVAEEVDIVKTVGDKKTPNDDEENPVLPKLPWVGTGELDLPQYIIDALKFIKHMFSKVWVAYGDFVVVVTVPIMLALIGFAIGRGFNKSE